MIDKTSNRNLPSSQRVIKQEKTATELKSQSTNNNNNNNKNNSTNNNTNTTTTNNNNNNSSTNNNNHPVNRKTLDYPAGPSKKLSRNELFPPTPSILVNNETEVFSPQLQEFCLAHPISVIRNICRVLNLNLGLFSTKTLVETDADQFIEIRRQLQQPSDQNWDVEKKKMIWRCESPRNFLKISNYANYQASTFLTKGEEELNPSSNNVVTFGTNVDLSDPKKWRAQLGELDKLPMFSRVVSATNMLTHVGHSILGMNTVQLYMKVPGCRTPGHQENNNFCSVNINIGPGDCEWFGVPEEYWGPMAKLCAENNTNFVHGSWWPNLEDLYACNIPVYRFIQKPGDLVWVNTGTVHWVQAIGCCNNIAWNVGPITCKQYRSAIERYEWNKLEKYKSIVPMIHLTWNLAKNVEILDESLFTLIKNFMTKTLDFCERMITMLEASNIDVRWHGKGENEVAHYCSSCDIEVFNILFVKCIEKKNTVYCAKCAIKTSQILENFTVLQEYDITYLKEIYSNFKRRHHNQGA